MVAPVERTSYREQLHALLPQGSAWPREPGTVLDDLLDAIAEQLARVDSSGSNLLDDIRPNNTLDLLSDWERVAGLPDSCSVDNSSVAVRRASLLEKLVTKTSPSPAEFRRIGDLFGVTITVEEFDQTRATTWANAQSPAVDVTSGKWRYVWWITIPTSADVARLTTVSTVDTPFKSVGRNSELECRLRGASPAHSHLIIEYNAVPALPALGRPFACTGPRPWCSRRHRAATRRWSTAWPICRRE